MIENYDDLIIDNFAGGGGASEAIFRALGRHPDIAINHDGEALAMHAANHPNTLHFKEDVFDIDPMLVTRGKRIKFAWFSPDCKHHSKAKGAAPKDQKIRGLAWVMLKWAAHKRPEVMGLENVEEFLDWGPLDSQGYAIKTEKGRTFKALVLALTTGLPEDHPDMQEIYHALGADFDMRKLHKGLGYIVDHRVLAADDYGAPTIRKRLYMQMRCDGRPITWPVPTHGNPKKKDLVKAGLLPRRTAAECIDWSIPVPSIFGRKKPLADKTLARIAKGIMKFVINSDDPFIVPVTLSDGGGNKTETFLAKFSQNSIGHDLDEPLHTVMAGAPRFGLVTASLTEHANGSSQRVFDIEEPLRTQCATVKGGHFAVVAAMLKHYTGVVGTELKVPFGTVTTTDHHAIMTSNIMKLRGQNIGHAMDEPLHTISAGGTHHAEVRALLVKYYSEGGQWQPMTDPMHTIPTKARLALVTVKGELYAITDIGMRMLTPRELARAQGFYDDYILDPEITVTNHRGKKVTKRLSAEAQVRMIGNSVSPYPAEAIIREAFKHELEARQVEAA